jgi:hypothetical protein
MACIFLVCLAVGIFGGTFVCHLCCRVTNSGGDVEQQKLLAPISK